MRGLSNTLNKLNMKAMRICLAEMFSRSRSKLNLVEKHFWVKYHQHYPIILLFYSFEIEPQYFLYTENNNTVLIFPFCRSIVNIMGVFVATGTSIKYLISFYTLNKCKKIKYFLS